MKQMKRPILWMIGALACSSVVLFSGIVMGDEWILLDDNEYLTYFYDNQSIHCESLKYCSVWTKLIYSEKGRLSYLNELTKQNLSTLGYDLLRGSAVQSMYNCESRSFCLTQIIDYDEGKI